MIHHRRALINSADYYWLLRRSRGQNDDPHVAAEVSVTNVTFPSTVSSSVCRGHTRRQASFQRAVNASWNFFFSIRGATFFLNFARTQKLIIFSKFVCHLYQADCKIFFLVFIYFIFARSLLRAKFSATDMIAWFERSIIYLWFYIGKYMMRLLNFCWAAQLD